MENKRNRLGSGEDSFHPTNRVVATVLHTLVPRKSPDFKNQFNVRSSVLFATTEQSIPARTTFERTQHLQFCHHFAINFIQPREFPAIS